MESIGAVMAWSLRLRPARSRRLQAFSKPFQISAIFCQAFPKNVLAVLWDFKGLQ
jgi:hypothetical protein